jgi:Phosphoesterase family
VTNLEKVDHIVVLMLENRSFDHMLGYLSLEGSRGDVDGLRGEFGNEHDGRSYPIHHLDSTSIADDPDHSASSVDLQIGGGAMDGFVTSGCTVCAAPGHEDARSRSRGACLGTKRPPGRGRTSRGSKPYASLLPADLSGLSARQTASPSHRVDGVPAEGSSQVACVLDHRVVRLGVDVAQRLVEVEAVLLKHN